MLWIKDTSVEPLEKWHYFVPETKYSVVSNSYSLLMGKIARHCRTNGVIPPTQDQVTQFLCDNVTIDCRDGRDPYPNKWTAANPNPHAIQPLPREQWPIWAAGLALLAASEDRGLGDVISRTIGPIGGAAFKAWHLAIFGRPCGCSERQNKFNDKYPLH